MTADRPTVTAGRVVRAAAIVFVVALLGLLIWDVTHGGGGSTFVSQIEHGKKPLAPAFALPVLWARSETWPARLRSRLADSRLSMRELRGHPVVLNFWA